MAESHERIESAFSRLERLPGYASRPDQIQLSLLISDCIEEGHSAAYEAPTGLGKSLAALIPALVHAATSNRRTVIATYTNVLAEQYWRKDLPLASLLVNEKVKTQFLIGRQRYACLAAMAELPKSVTSAFKSHASLGIETEFREHSRKFGKELTQLWQQIAAPPVCPSRLCPYYHDCYYYSARWAADKAGVIITNHSVVLQDALLKKASDGELSLLGDYDFLVIDEAHDFAQAALNSLEFELGEQKLGVIGSIAQRMQKSLQNLSMEAAQPHIWNELCDSYREHLAALQKQFAVQAGALQSGILRATPDDVWAHPQVKARSSHSALAPSQQLASEVAKLNFGFLNDIDKLIGEWRHTGAVSGTQADEALEAIHNYSMFIREFAIGCQLLFSDDMSGAYQVGVTYCSGAMAGRYGRDSSILRHDVIGLGEPLRELIWEQVPSVSLSATLALDGNFDFYKRMTGATPDFEEVLPSPFDHGLQAALYLPKDGAIPDPGVAQKSGGEHAYYDALAEELAKIIRKVNGRTLALFHSRKEMEAVHERIVLPPDLPIYVQRGSSVGWVGEKFKSETHASLFALRSFWTGFDAPGETLSCVVLVRVPFEVPVDPAQVARMAWLQTQGLDPFGAYSLPQAKMLIRQGAGRLIRTTEDRGIIALLDPRITTKRYGEEILRNLPTGMRTYNDIEEAAAAVGLSQGTSDVLSLSLES